MQRASELHFREAALTLTSTWDCCGSYTQGGLLAGYTQAACIVKLQVGTEVAGRETCN